MYRVAVVTVGTYYDDLALSVTYNTIGQPLVVIIHLMRCDDMTLNPGVASIARN